LEKWLAGLGLLTGSFLAANAFSAHHSLKRVYAYERPTRPPYSVSVIAPGWHEPDKLLETSLSSLKQQSVVQEFPELFDFTFVGCEGANLNIPTNYGYRVLCAPRGKLNARHVGIMNAHGDLIVSVDCDSYYPPNWLNLMLKPFNDRSVVGTSSTTWQERWEYLTALLKLGEYSNRMSGRGSAFLKSAYIATGGFNLNIDQRDILTLLMEEEVGFKKRLERVGKVVLVDAPVIHLGGTSKRGLRGYPRGKGSYATVAKPASII
jgi:cellulose synthase/poly-beta-1,6-N-acetylglucosamine synthase-like glycosyltransferase